MSLRIYVDAYSGYRANKRPMSFSVDLATGENVVTGVYDIEAVEDRWYDANAEYFKVRTTEGKRYILRYADREEQWTLQSGFDGTELLARPRIELVAVEPSAIRQAELKIAGCVRCRADESDIPFDSILPDVLGTHGPFEFVMSEPGRCPNCKGALSERALVEPQGGIEVETME